MKRKRQQQPVELVSGKNDDGNILLLAPPATCFSCFIEIPPHLTKLFHFIIIVIFLNITFIMEIISNYMPNDKFLGIAAVNGNFADFSTRMAFCKNCLLS